MDYTVHSLSMSEALQILGGPGKELAHILSSALFCNWIDWEGWLQFIKGWCLYLAVWRVHCLTPGLYSSRSHFNSWVNGWLIITFLPESRPVSCHLCLLYLKRMSWKRTKHSCFWVQWHISYSGRFSSLSIRFLDGVRNLSCLWLTFVLPSWAGYIHTSSQWKVASCFTFEKGKPSHTF